MSKELDNLTAAVTKLSTVDASVIALLQSLATQFAAAKTDPVAVQALADSVNAQAQSLSDAVTANTPAA